MITSTSIILIYCIGGGNDLIHTTRNNHTHYKNVLCIFGSLSGSLIYYSGSANSTSRFENIIATPSVDTETSDNVAIAIQGGGTMSLHNIHAVSARASDSENVAGIYIFGTQRVVIDTLTGGEMYGGICLDGGGVEDIYVNNHYMSPNDDRGVHQDGGVNRVFLGMRDTSLDFNDPVMMDMQSERFNWSLASVAQDFRVTATHSQVNVNSSQGVFEITLDSGIEYSDREIIIGDEGNNASVNNITVKNSGGSIVEIINTEGAESRLYCDGSEWSVGYSNIS